MGVEGLQALKPRSKNVVLLENSKGNNQAGTGMKTMDSGDIEGVNVEACLILPEDGSAEEDKFTVQNIRFSVKQPVSISLVIIIIIYHSLFLMVMANARIKSDDCLCRLRLLQQRRNWNTLPFSADPRSTQWGELQLEFCGCLSLISPLARPP